MGTAVQKNCLETAGEYRRETYSGFRKRGRHYCQPFFTEKNDVTAIEPSEEMPGNAWMDFPYEQIIGDAASLADFQSNSFDSILCRNVLEYIDDKASVVKELERVLKKGGTLSVVKHNRAGRVMQMAVLLNDFDKANALLDGQNSTASKFGEIRYYEDSDLSLWGKELKVDNIYGIRTLWELQQSQEDHTREDWQEKMAALESRVAQIPEYRGIAFFHHIVLRRR